MRQKIQQFSQRPFVRNVAAVAGGTAASQAISMAFSPLITRLYGPEAYGIQGVFMSIAGIIGTIAAMTYPIAIVLPKSDTDALGLARLSIYIGIVTSLLVTLALFLFGQEILSLLNAQEISAFMYLIPVSMLIAVAGGVVNQWLIRKKAFILTAKVAVWQTLLMSTVKAGLGFVYPTAAVLVVTNISSDLLSTVLMLLGLRRGRVRHIIEQAETKDSESGLGEWELAKRHRDFPLLRAPQVLLNAASQSLPILLLANYFGVTAAGFYSIATVVLGVPAGLIGNSVKQVFYPRFNEAVHNRENLSALMLKTIISMGMIGLLPFSVVMVFGPSLFDVVFGAAWRTAGEYGRWLAIWFFFELINRPVVSAIPVIRLQGVFLIYEILSVLLRVAALYIGFVVLQSDVGAVAVFSVAGVALSISLNLYVIWSCRTADIRCWKSEYR